jgi:hypothetical protein|tara:strand:+ start:2759 stop:3316 length:558 start_codon:yes stop_codon:yes gene_type:complete
MTILKKEEFLLKFNVNESTEVDEEIIDEFVDPDGSFSDSAVPDGNETNIQTGPVQKPAKDRGISNYEKGVSPDTDKIRRDTSQGSRWQRAFAGLGGTSYSHGERLGIGTWASMILHESSEERMKENIKSMIEDIVSKGDENSLVSKISNKELFKKDNFTDLVSKIDKLSDEEREELKKLLSDAKS